MGAFSGWEAEYDREQFVRDEYAALRARELDLTETWHIAKPDSDESVCGDQNGVALSDPKNIADARARGILCRDCEREEWERVG